MLQYLTKFSLEFFYVAIAAIGGIARYFQLYLETGEFKFTRFLAHTFVSAFSGVMFGQVGGSLLGLENISLMAVVGMGGYMGSETLKFLEKKLERNENTPPSR